MLEIIRACKAGNLFSLLIAWAYYIPEVPNKCQSSQTGNMPWFEEIVKFNLSHKVIGFSVFPVFSLTWKPDASQLPKSISQYILKLHPVWLRWGEMVKLFSDLHWWEFRNSLGSKNHRKMPFQHYRNLTYAFLWNWVRMHVIHKIRN